jgi:hypothetical protein
LKEPSWISEPDVPDATATVDAAGRSRRVNWRLLIVSLAIAIGLGLVVRGLMIGITGDERAALPDLVEQVAPVPDAVQALSQTNVYADLADGYTGRFVIDGTAIETANIDELGTRAVEPGQQVDLPPVTIYEPGNATLTFTPSDDAPISGFESGEHTIRLVYWRIDEGEQRARTFTWTFNVV